MTGGITEPYNLEQDKSLFTGQRATTACWVFHNLRCTPFDFQELDHLDYSVKIVFMICAFDGFAGYSRNDQAGLVQDVAYTNSTSIFPRSLFVMDICSNCATYHFGNFFSLVGCTINSL